MLNFISKNSLQDQTNYNHINTMMDTQNFLTYFILQIYNANTDWPHKNIRFWRYENVQNEENLLPQLDGRWRWLVFDVDRSLGYVSYSHNTLKMVTDEFHHRNSDQRINFLLRALLENDSFTLDFINEFADHLNTTFSHERVIDNIDTIKEAIKPEMTRHIDRWGMPTTYQEWLDNVDIMREFALNRPGIVRQHIIEHFNLSGTSKLHVMYHNSYGKIKVNTVSLSDNTWY
ncbi:CotH kinase family protein [Evansella tamaricis]